VTHGDQSAGIDAEVVRAQVERILLSRPFAQAGRASRPLRFSVEEALQGRGDQIKEYVLGVEVFDKGEAFDPRLDPAVRVEVHRLRTKLDKYYAEAGRNDSILIEFPKGSYTPVIRHRTTAGGTGKGTRRWKLLLLLASALVAAGMVYLATQGRTRKTGGTEGKELSSIAVLPFSDLSPEKDQDYFCEGITEELTNALAKVEGLRVVSRTSAFQFKGKASDIRKIGEQLNVGALLEGSVRRAGNKLRVTAQLVKVSDGYHLWSGTYDRETGDVFAIQEEISRAIVNALQVRLSAEPNRRLLEGHTENLHAYNLYLQGRYHWNRRTEAGLRKGIEYFEQAIAEEQNYAAAHAGLADSYALLASYGVAPPKQAMPKAKAAALETLRIDDTFAQAHATLGFVLSFYDWDWVAAEREYQRAIELNPGNATAHQWYSGYLRAVGRLDQALREMKRAQELDPLSLAAGRDMGRIFRSMRQYDRAIDQYRKVLELDPNFPSVYLHLGMAYEQKGMYRQAVAAFEKARSLPGGNPLILGALGHGYAVSGNRREAERLLKQLNDLSTRRYTSPISTVLIYIGLGERDRAFEWLDRAYEDHDPWLTWLAVDPIFDTLRPDPRFGILLRKVGLQR
jgi:TolB-like protein/Flp pilus assembly protein TadD